MQFISSGTLRTLFVLCFCFPLLLALAGIFSTTIDTSIQSQLVMGMPLFLWFWLSVSFVICATIITVGLRLTYQSYDDTAAMSDSDINPHNSQKAMPTNKGVSHE